jgi:hypothetical protein
MKKVLKVMAAAAVLASGSLAVAGDCGAGSSGFACENMCPLAKSAGARRSFGNEGGTVRQAALTAMVQKALAKV